MIGIWPPGRIEKGDIGGKRCPGTRAESRPSVPGLTHYPKLVCFRA